MNFMLHISLCSFLALCAVAIYVYRHWLENQDDPYIHLHGDSHDEGIISSQTSINKRLEAIDRVKYGVLAATILYAAVIAAMGAYWAWNN